MIEYFLLGWLVVSCITTHTVYFYFDYPWHGPNKVWWSVLLHLPFIVLVKVVPTSWIESKMVSEKQSTKLTWKSFRW